MILRDQHTRLPVPLIVNNGFRVLNFGILTASGKWDAMESWTGTFLLLWSLLLPELHMVFIWLLGFSDYSGQRLD